MESRQYIVQDEVGLHARSVSLIAGLALSHPESSITISFRDKEASATHLMAMMAMLVKKGDTIVITVEGGDEKGIVKNIINVLNAKKV